MEITAIYLRFLVKLGPPFTDRIFMRFCNSLRAVVPLFLFLFGFLLAPGARAVEIETVPGLFYFTGDKELLQSASVERAEEGVQFAAPRDPRLVAMDHAQEELRQIGRAHV